MVALPDHKQWWRNFEGDGGTLQLKLKGADHTGHAISSRDEKGRVTVESSARRLTLGSKSTKLVAFSVQPVLESAAWTDAASGERATGRRSSTPPSRSSQRRTRYRPHSR